MVSASLAKRLNILQLMKPSSKTFRSANGGQHKPPWITDNQALTMGNSTVPIYMFFSAANYYTILLGNLSWR